MPKRTLKRIAVTLPFYRIRTANGCYITAAYSETPRRISADEVQFASCTSDKTTAETWQKIHGGSIEEFELTVEVPEVLFNA